MADSEEYIGFLLEARIDLEKSTTGIEKDLESVMAHANGVLESKGGGINVLSDASMSHIAKLKELSKSFKTDHLASAGTNLKALAGGIRAVSGVGKDIDAVVDQVNAGIQKLGTIDENIVSVNRKLSALAKSSGAIIRNVNELNSLQFDSKLGNLKTDKFEKLASIIGLIGRESASINASKLTAITKSLGALAALPATNNAVLLLKGIGDNSKNIGSVATSVSTLAEKLNQIGKTKTSSDPFLSYLTSLKSQLESIKALQKDIATGKNAVGAISNITNTVQAESVGRKPRTRSRATGDHESYSIESPSLSSGIGKEFDSAVSGFTYTINRLNTSFATFGDRLNKFASQLSGAQYSPPAQVSTAQQMQQAQVQQMQRTAPAPMQPRSNVAQPAPAIAASQAVAPYNQPSGITGRATNAMRVTSEAIHNRTSGAVTAPHMRENVRAFGNSYEDHIENLKQKTLNSGNSDAYAAARRLQAIMDEFDSHAARHNAGASSALNTSGRVIDLEKRLGTIGRGFEGGKRGPASQDVHDAYKHVQKHIEEQAKTLRNNSDHEIKNPQVSLQHIGAGSAIGDLAIHQIRQMYGHKVSSKLTVAAQPFSGGIASGQSSVNANTINAVKLAKDVQRLMASGEIRGEQDIFNQTAPVQNLVRQATATGLHEAGHALVRDALSDADKRKLFEQFKKDYGIKFNAKAARAGDLENVYTSNDSNLNEHTIKKLMGSGAYQAGSSEEDFGQFFEEMIVDAKAKHKSGVYKLKNGDTKSMQFMESLFQSGGHMTRDMVKMLHGTNAPLSTGGKQGGGEKFSIEADMLNTIAQVGPDVADLLKHVDRNMLDGMGHIVKARINNVLTGAMGAAQKALGAGGMASKIGRLLNSIVPQQQQLALAGGHYDEYEVEGFYEVDLEKYSMEGDTPDVVKKPRGKKKPAPAVEALTIPGLSFGEPEGTVEVAETGIAAAQRAEKAEKPKPTVTKAEKQANKAKAKAVAAATAPSDVTKKGDEEGVVPFDRSKGNWREIATADDDMHAFSVLAAVDSRGNIDPSQPYRVHKIDKSTNMEAGDVSLRNRSTLNSVLGKDAQRNLSFNLNPEEQSRRAAELGYGAGAPQLNEGEFFAATSGLKIAPSELNSKQLTQVKSQIHRFSAGQDEELKALSNFFVMGNEIYQQVGDHAYKIEGGWSKLSQVLAAGGSDAKKAADLVSKAKAHYDTVTNKKASGGVFDNASTEAEGLYRHLAEKADRSFSDQFLAGAGATHPSPEFDKAGSKVSFVKDGDENYIVDSGRRRAHRYGDNQEGYDVLRGMLQPHERKNEASAIERLKAMGGKGQEIAEWREGELNKTSEGKAKLELDKKIATEQKAAMAEAQKLSSEKIKAARDEHNKSRQDISGGLNTERQKADQKAADRAKEVNRAYEVKVANVEADYRNDKIDKKSMQAAKAEARYDKQASMEEIAAQKARTIAEAEAKAREQAVISQNKLDRALRGAEEIVKQYQQAVLTTIDSMLRSGASEKDARIAREKSVAAARSIATTAASQADPALDRKAQEAADAKARAQTDARSQENERVRKANNHRDDMVSKAHEAARASKEETSDYHRLKGAASVQEFDSMSRNAQAGDKTRIVHQGGKKFIVDDATKTAKPYDSDKNAVSLIKSGIGGKLEEDTILDMMGAQGGEAQRMAEARRAEIKAEKDAADARKADATAARARAEANRTSSDAKKAAKEKADQDKKDALAKADAQASVLSGLPMVGNAAGVNDLRDGGTGIQKLLRDKAGNLSGVDHVRTVDQLFKHLGGQMQFGSDAEASSGVGSVIGALTKVGMGKEIGSSTGSGGQIIKTIQDQYGNLHTIVQDGAKVFIESYDKNMMLLAKKLREMGADLNASGISNKVQEDIKSKADKIAADMAGKTVLGTKQRGKDTLHFFDDGGTLKAGVEREGQFHGIETASSKDVLKHGEEAKGMANLAYNQMVKEGYASVHGARTYAGGAGAAHLLKRDNGDNTSSFSVLTRNADGRGTRKDFENEAKAIAYLNRIGAQLSSAEKAKLPVDTSAEKAKRDADKKAKEAAQQSFQTKGTADMAKATVKFRDTAGETVGLYVNAIGQLSHVIVDADGKVKKNQAISQRAFMGLLKGAEKTIAHTTDATSLPALLKKQLGDHEHTVGNYNTGATAYIHQGVVEGKNTTSVAIEQNGRLVVQTFANIGAAARELASQGYHLDDALKAAAEAGKKAAPAIKDFSNIQDIIAHGKGIQWARTKRKDVTRSLEYDDEGNAHFKDTGTFRGPDGKWHKVTAKYEAESDGKGGFKGHGDKHAFSGKMMDGFSTELHAVNAGFTGMIGHMAKSAAEMIKWNLQWMAVAGSMALVGAALHKIGAAALEFKSRQYDLAEKIGAGQNISDDFKRGAFIPKASYNEEAAARSRVLLGQGMDIVAEAGVKDTSKMPGALAGLGMSLQAEGVERPYEEGLKSLQTLARYSATNDVDLDQMTGFGQSMIRSYGVGTDGLNGLLDNASMFSGRHGVDEKLWRQGMVATASGARTANISKDTMSLYVASNIKGFSEEDAAKNLSAVQSLPSTLGDFNNINRIRQLTGGDKVLTDMINNKASVGDKAARIDDVSMEMFEKLKASGGRDLQTKESLKEIAKLRGYGSMRDYELVLQNEKNLVTEQGKGSILELQRSGDRLNNMQSGTDTRWDAKSANDPQMALNKIAAGLQKLFHTIGGGAADGFKNTLDHIASVIEKIAAKEDLLIGIGGVIAGIFDAIIGGVTRLAGYVTGSEEGKEMTDRTAELGAQIKAAKGDPSKISEAIGVWWNGDTKAAARGHVHKEETTSHGDAPAQVAMKVVERGPGAAPSKDDEPKAPILASPNSGRGAKHLLWDTAVAQKDNPYAQGLAGLFLGRVVNQIAAAKVLHNTTDGTDAQRGMLRKGWDVAGPDMSLTGKKAWGMWRDAAVQAWKNRKNAPIEEVAPQEAGPSRMERARDWWNNKRHNIKAGIDQPKMADGSLPTTEHTSVAARESQFHEANNRQMAINKQVDALQYKGYKSPFGEVLQSNTEAINERAFKLAANESGMTVEQAELMASKGTRVETLERSVRSDFARRGHMPDKAQQMASDPRMLEAARIRAEIGEPMGKFIETFNRIVEKISYNKAAPLLVEQAQAGVETAKARNGLVEAHDRLEASKKGAGEKFSIEAPEKATRQLKNSADAVVELGNKSDSSFGKIGSAWTKLVNALSDAMGGLSSKFNGFMESMRSAGQGISDFIARITGKTPGEPVAIEPATSKAPTRTPPRGTLPDTPGGARGTQRLTPMEEAAAGRASETRPLTPEEAAQAAKGAAGGAAKSALARSGQTVEAMFGKTGSFKRGAAMAKGLNRAMIPLAVAGTALEGKEVYDTIADTRATEKETEEKFAALRARKVAQISGQIAKLREQHEKASPEERRKIVEKVEKLRGIQEAFVDNDRKTITTKDFVAAPRINLRSGLAGSFGLGGGILGGVAGTVVPGAGTAVGGVVGGGIGYAAGESASYLAGQATGADMENLPMGFDSEKVVTRKQTAAEAFQALSDELAQALRENTDATREATPKAAEKAKAAAPKAEDKKAAAKPAVVEKHVEKVETIIREVDKNKFNAGQGLGAISSDVPASEGGASSGSSMGGDTAGMGQRLGLKNMGTLAPIVSKYAQERGIPPEVVMSIMQVESGGNIGARSPAGALGSMQVMPGTAKGMGIDPQQLLTADGGVNAGTKYIQTLASQLKARLKKSGTTVSDDKFWSLVGSMYLTGPGHSSYDRGQFPGGGTKDALGTTGSAYGGKVGNNLRTLGYGSGAGPATGAARTSGPGFLSPDGKHTFEQGIGTNRGDHRHMGQDVGQAAGSALLAQSAGTFIGYGDGGRGGGMARYRDSMGNEVRVMHVVPGGLTPGQKIMRGTPLGTVAGKGSKHRGNASYDHGHWEVRKKGGGLMNIRDYAKSTAVGTGEIDPAAFGANAGQGGSGDDRLLDPETQGRIIGANFGKASSEVEIARQKLAAKQITAQEFASVVKQNEGAMKAAVEDAKGRLKDIEQKLASASTPTEKADLTAQATQVKKEIADYETAIGATVKEAGDNLREQMLQAMDMRLGILDSYIARIGKARERFETDAIGEFTVTQEAQGEQLETLNKQEAFIKEEMQKAELAKDHAKQLELQGKLKDIALKKDEIATQMLQNQLKLVTDYFATYRSLTELKGSYNKLSFTGTQLEDRMAETAGESQFTAGNEAFNKLSIVMSKPEFIEGFNKAGIDKLLNEYLTKAVEKADAMVKKFKEWVGVLQTGVDAMGVLAKSEVAVRGNAAVTANNQYIGGIADYAKAMAANPNMPDEEKARHANVLMKLQNEAREATRASIETNEGQTLKARNASYRSVYGGEGFEAQAQLRETDGKRNRLLREQAATFVDMGLNEEAGSLLSMQGGESLDPDKMMRIQSAINKKGVELDPSVAISFARQTADKAGEVGTAAGSNINNARKTVNEIMYAYRKIKANGGQATPQQLAFLKQHMDKLRQGGTPLFGEGGALKGMDAEGQQMMQGLSEAPTPEAGMEQGPAEPRAPRQPRNPNGDAQEDVQEGSVLPPANEVTYGAEAEDGDASHDHGDERAPSGPTPGAGAAEGGVDKYDEKQTQKLTPDMEYNPGKKDPRLVQAGKETLEAFEKNKTEGVVKNPDFALSQQMQEQTRLTQLMGDALARQVEMLDVEYERLQSLAKLEQLSIENAKSSFSNEELEGSKYSDLSRKWGNIVGDSAGFEMQRGARVKGNVIDIQKEQRAQADMARAINEAKSRGENTDLMEADLDASKLRENKARIELDYNLKDLNPLQERFMEIAKDFSHGLSDAFKSAAAEYFKFIPDLEKKQSQVNRQHMQEKVMDMFMPASPGQMKMRQFRDLNLEMEKEQHDFSMTNDPGYRFNFEMKKKMNQLPGELMSKGANIVGDVGQGFVQTALTDPGKIGSLLGAITGGDLGGIFGSAKDILAQGQQDPVQLELNAAKGLNSAATKLNKEMDLYHKLAKVNLDLQKAYAMESSMALIGAAAAIEEAAFRLDPKNKDKEYDRDKGVWGKYGSKMEERHNSLKVSEVEAASGMLRQQSIADSINPTEMLGKIKESIGDAGKMNEIAQALGVDTGDLGKFIGDANNVSNMGAKDLIGFVKNGGKMPAVTPGLPGAVGTPGAAVAGQAGAAAAAPTAASIAGAGIAAAGTTAAAAMAAGTAANWIGDNYMNNGAGKREREVRNKNGTTGMMAGAAIGAGIMGAGAALSASGIGAPIGIPVMLVGGAIAGLAGAGLGRSQDDPALKKARREDREEEENKRKFSEMQGEEMEIQRRLLDATIAQTRALQYQGQNFASLGDLIRQDVKLLSTSADISGRGGDQRITGMAVTGGSGLTVSGGAGQTGSGGGFPGSFGGGLTGGSYGLSSIPGFSEGGLVPGEGNSDSVLARLTPGEFVLTKQEVEQIRNYNVGTTSSAEMFKNMGAQQGAIQAGLNLAGFEQTINLKYNTPDAPSLEPINQDVNMRYGSSRGVNASFYKNNGGDFMREARNRGIN